MIRTILAATLAACAVSTADAQTNIFVPNGAVPSYNPYRPGGMPTGVVPGSTPYQAVGPVGTAPPGVLLPGQSYLRTSPSDPFGLGNNTNRDFQVVTPQQPADRDPRGQTVQQAPSQATPPQIPPQTSGRTGTAVQAKGLVSEGAAQVVDGDTLTIGGRFVTLFGADAPEVGQVCSAGGTAWRCGEKARDRLTALVDGRHLRCVGELPAGDAVSSVCSTVDGLDPGLILVTEGLAVVPKAVSTRYLAAEADARTGRRGVWVGSFEAPWEYRRKLLGKAPVAAR